MIGGRASVLVFLLRSHHNPMRTFSSLKDLTQPALSFLLSFQLLILHFIIPKMSSLSAISYFKVQHSAPYVASGLIDVFKISILFLLVRFDPLV